MKFDPAHDAFLLFDHADATEKSPAPGIRNRSSGAEIWRDDTQGRFAWAAYCSGKLISYFDLKRGFRVSHLDAQGVPVEDQAPGIQEFDFRSLAGCAIEESQLSSPLGAWLASQSEEAHACAAEAVAGRDGKQILCLPRTGSLPRLSTSGSAPVIFETFSHRLIAQLEKWDRTMYSAAGHFSPDNSLFAMDQHIWETAGGKYLWGAPGNLDFGVFSRDSRRIFFWSFRDPEKPEHRPFDSHSGKALGASIPGYLLWTDATGHRAIANKGSAVYVWDVDGGKPLRSFDITQPDDQARARSLQMLSGSTSVEDLLGIARLELHACEGSP